MFSEAKYIEQEIQDKLVNTFTPKLTSTWYLLVQIDIPRFFRSLITNSKLE